MVDVIHSGPSVSPAMPVGNLGTAAEIKVAFRSAKVPAPRTANVAEATNDSAVLIRVTAFSVASQLNTMHAPSLAARIGQAECPRFSGRTKTVYPWVSRWQSRTKHLVFTTNF